MKFPKNINGVKVKSIEELMELAKTEAQAQYEMAGAYLEGDGVPQDNDKAFHYTSLAAAQKYTQSIIDLAYFYRKGIGCKRDVLKSEELFLEAMRLGDDEALGFLAEIYLFGMGPIKQDMLKGLDYMNRALQASCNVDDLLAFCNCNKREFFQLYHTIKAGKVPADALRKLEKAFLAGALEEYKVDSEQQQQEETEAGEESGCSEFMFSPTSLAMSGTLGGALRWQNKK